MLARCARCQNNFTTDRFGVQKCPHCGTELLLADPSTPATPPPPEPTAPPSPEGAAPDSQSAGPQPGSASPPPNWDAAPPPPQPWVPPAAQPAPPPSAQEQPAPFAERDGLGWFSAFGKTWKLVALEPQRFFRSVRIDQTQSAILFGVIAITLAQWLVAAFTYLAGPSMIDMLSRLPSNSLMEAMFTLPALAFRIVTAPVLALVSIYLSSALFHLILLIFGGAKRGFGATLTVVGYASGVLLLGAVPLCGASIAGIWFLVVAVFGIAEAQRCGLGKGAVAVLLPFALTCLCCGAIIVALLSIVTGYMG